MTTLGSVVYAFFERHLKGVRNGVDGWPRVRYYTLGSEEWRETPVWPPAGTVSHRNR